MKHATAAPSATQIPLTDTPMTAGRVIVVIPAYHEEPFIGSVVLKARRHAETVIVVDDSSPDQTGAIAEAAGAVVISHTTNRGKGAALNTGLATARKLDPDVVILMDADGQHDAADIPCILEAFREHQADIVIGSRFLTQPNRAPAYRQVGQWIMTRLANVTSGVRVTDSSSGFRALSRRAVQVIRFQENGWGIDAEVQFQAKQHGLRIADVPIDVRYDEPAKRNPVLHGLRTIQDILRLARRHRPLLVFLSVGIASLLAGLGTGLWVIDRYAQLKVLPGGWALVAVTLVILGMLTIYAGMILHFLRELLIGLLSSGRDVASAHREHDDVVR